MSQTQVERLFIKDNTSLAADSFRLTSDLSTSDADITANLERADSTLAGKLGTAMSQSSGVFTFPSTGIYLVTFNIVVNRVGASRYIGAQIYGTANNGTAWDSIALSYSSIDSGDGSNASYQHHQASNFFDCVDTSTHKVKFYVNAAATCSFVGDSDRNTTSMVFQRVGNT
jgi:hypothetical protein